MTGVPQIANLNPYTRVEKNEVRLDSVTGALVGTLTVPSTGGMQNWTEVQTTISGTNGVHNVFFVFSGGTGNLFDWDFFYLIHHRQRKCLG